MSSSCSQDGARSLTICSVSFNSGPWLDLNRQLTVALNPGVTFSWVVAENSPVDSSLRVSPELSGFRIIPGAAFERRAYGSGSYHHGRGMNETLPHIRTRYALFCDPDFYIVRAGWIQAMLRHMQEQDVAILGVPWHPRWVHKRRYFPCVHCMFVDLAAVPAETLDFTPDIDGVPAYARTAGDRASTFGRMKLPDPLKLRKRRHIGTSRDVSWRIQDRYADDPGVRIECLQPVLRSDLSRLRQRVEGLLPDRWSLLPQRPGYFAERGFADLGLPDLDRRGWEEFLWRGRPFGFNVRSQPKLKQQDSLADHLADVRDILEGLATGPQPRGDLP